MNSTDLQTIEQLKSQLAIIEPLRAIGKLLREQDNLMTRNPIFTVESKSLRGFDKWEFVTACLTQKGCEDFIKADGHNYKRTRIYVASGYRNEEWQLIRDILKQL
jgi:hypothetical protein